MVKFTRKRFGSFSIVLLLVALLVVPVGAYAAADKPVVGNANGLAVSTNWMADAVAQKILDEGGNAIDAAAALGYALAVVHPTAGNIGGGGFAVIHLANGTNTTIDFREMAPAAAYREMYIDPTDSKKARMYTAADGTVLGEESLFGYKAAGVPGSVAGFNYMVEKYGVKKLSEVIDPAVRLAQNGFNLTAGTASSLNNYEYNKKYFMHFAGSKKYFTKADGTEFKAGELFKQSDLAETLKRIQRSGNDGFYKGKTAELIVADMPKYGGIITLADLANYKVVERPPVIGSYHTDYTIVSMGPPSSGGTHILQILNTVENFDVGSSGFNSAMTVHYLVEAMRYAYIDRTKYMGDPDFVTVPVARLTDKDYAKIIWNKILAHDTANGGPTAGVSKLADASGLAPLHEGEETTHYSVVDKFGNAVGVTYTINMGYGCKAAVDGAGFFMNNEMDDFMSVPGVPNGFGLIQGEANNIQPGKRPLSSMSPTIVLKGGKTYMVTGSPGGSQIITTTLQTVSNVVDHGMNVSEAVAAPRIHHQWFPDDVGYEKNSFTSDTAKILSDDMGYTLTRPRSQGDVDAILVTDTGAFHGAHDPRTYDVPPSIDLDLGSNDDGGSSGCDVGFGVAAFLIAGLLGLKVMKKK
ncbi:gamma-glutamyltransferase [Synergistales bacterium]|nr:gamma-glutamyltransferase [Synergistales bacterium]